MSNSCLMPLFSSVWQKTVPGIAFFALSPVSTTKRRAFPLRVEQGIRTEAEKAAQKAKAQARRAKAPSQQRKSGRPQGSKNKNKAEVLCSLHLLSKLRSDAALYFPYVGSQPRRGPRRK